MGRECVEGLEHSYALTAPDQPRQHPGRGAAAWCRRGLLGDAADVPDQHDHGVEPLAATSDIELQDYDLTSVAGSGA
ncbi:hypothetical protein [Saccharopolyspora sp. NPDC002376]